MSGGRGRTLNYKGRVQSRKNKKCKYFFAFLDELDHFTNILHIL